YVFFGSPRITLPAPLGVGALINCKYLNIFLEDPMRTVSILAAAIASSFIITPSAFSAETYKGSTYGTVWGQVQSDPFEVLPERHVTIRSFGAWLSQY